jgi:hypothetical protein
MPIEYVLLAINGNHRNVEPTRILTTKIIELKKLQENKLKVQNNVGTNQWNKFLCSQQKHTKKKFQFGNFVLWFPKGENTHLNKFKKRWFGPFRV